MAPTAANATPNLGFLTVVQEANGYLGGYLVTNLWGRPLEFRLSTAVQPNRIQQILYGSTLQPYICADLIGKALVEKASTPAQVILTDREAVLELRWNLEAPVVWLAPANEPHAAERSAAACVCPARAGQGPVFCHPQFAGDAAAVRELLERLDGTVDLAEPFARIREAVAEARKMGVTSRG